MVITLKVNQNLLESALSLVQQGINEGYFPGATVAIGHKNGIYAVRQYGKACTYPFDVELNENTLQVQRWFIAI